MNGVPDKSEPLTAIHTDLGAIFVSLELSRSSWLITSLSPGGGEKMSKHSVPGGDFAGLMERLVQLQKKAKLRTGQSFRIIVVQEAGLDRFWIHRALQNEGIESHVVDAASIATSRRRRRAKTDKIDGETLVRTLLAYKRGEPRVCAVLKVPTPDEEDRRHLCRERKALTAERVRHVNRIKGFLFSQGVSGYQPLRRDRRQRLEELQTGDGRAFPQHLKALVNRELDRLELLLKQIKAVETARDALLAVNKRPRRRRQRCYLTLEASDQNSPPYSGRRGYSDTLKTDGRSRRTRVWPRHPGRAARSIENRECPKPATGDCEQH